MTHGRASFFKLGSKKGCLSILNDLSSMIAVSEQVLF